MKPFAKYLTNLPKTPLVEAVKALYENIDTEFDPFPEVTDDQMVELTRRATDYAVRLQPFGSNLLAENCVDNFYDIQDSLTGRNKSTVRCVHYTKSQHTPVRYLSQEVHRDEHHFHMDVRS